MKELIDRSSLLGGRLPALALLGLLAAAASGQSDRGGEVAAWVEDVDELERLLLETHLDVARLVDPERIRRAADKLRARLPELERHEIIVAMSKIAALPRDGHTHLHLFQEEAGFRVFPFHGYDFSDGYFVLDAREPYQALAGQRLVGIGRAEVEEVFAALDEVASGENEGFRRFNAGSQLRLAELLQALGFQESAERGTFTVEDAEGRRTTYELEPLTLSEFRDWSRSRPRSTWEPEAIRGKGQPYWHTLLEDTGTLYVWCGGLVGDDRSLAVEYVDELRKFAEGAEFERLVLDLRGNGGGSANNAVPFVRLLEGHPTLDRRGRSFTLTSPNTYSAAALFCGMLQNRTRTLFVGEPTGEGVNLFGDASSHSLPNSELVVRVSRRWWQCDIAEDTRNAMTLDLAVGRSRADYVSGRDAALEAVIDYRHEEPPVAALSDEEAGRYEGRYLFSAWQDLLVERRGEGLGFRLRDRIDGPTWLGEVVSDLRPVEGRFLTDVNGVTLLAAVPGSLPLEAVTFDWRGVEKRCPRLAPDHRLALERIDGDNVSGGPNGPEFPRGPSDRPKEIDANGVEAALEELLAERDRYPPKDILEARLNIAGYRFLRAGRVHLARRIFEANVELFPGSWNTHDSLGEALEKAGEREAALRAYRRSLELEPDNDSGKRAVRRLER